MWHPSGSNPDRCGSCRSRRIVKEQRIRVSAVSVVGCPEALVTRERIAELRPAQMLARLLQPLVRCGEIDEVGPVRLIGVAARVLAEGDVMRDS